MLCFLMVVFSCAKNKVVDSSGPSINVGTDSNLDIITWNIETFPKQGEITVGYLLEIIDSMDVDIIALQEIWGGGGATNSFDILKNKLDGWDGYRKSSGLAYLYKIEIVINDIYEINDLNELIRTPYLLSINWNGQDVIIINNHFKAFGGSDNEQQRKAASEKIRNYINEYWGNENIIILGDLNDELNDNGVNVFQNFINDSTNYMFVDMDIANGPSTNWSYPSWPSHIDHILITNELFDEFNNTSSTIQTIHIENYFEGGWRDYEKYVSDHRPIVLSLNFNLLRK